MPTPLTVTVHIAEAIRPAVDGRRQVSLGVPSTASVGDILESLFKLYPRLVQHMASERRGTASQGLRLVVASAELGIPDSAATRPESIQQGQRLYLFAAPARKTGAARG